MVALLGERYEVGRRLGRGGMAEVFDGHDRLLDRRVAVKILHPHLADDAEFLDRFRNEAKVVAPLKHSGIVRVLDVGVDDGRHYLVLEHVEGRTLAERLAEGPLPLAEAVAIVNQVCAALGAAHQRGVVHRDVKPANLMLTAHGMVKVMDFGTARLVDAATMSRTGAMVVGTPQYMSPEQFKGLPIDGRSDLYSLGVCLYAALTGRVPFSAPNPLVVAALHVNEQPLPPRLHLPELPAPVERMVLRALAKAPDERYQTATEFAVALEHAAAQAPAPVVPIAPRRKLGRRLLTAAALGLVAAFVVVGLPSSGGDGSATPVAAAEVQAADAEPVAGDVPAPSAPTPGPALAPAPAPGGAGPAVRSPPSRGPRRGLRDRRHVGRRTAPRRRRSPRGSPGGRAAPAGGRAGAGAGPTRGAVALAVP